MDFLQVKSLCTQFQDVDFCDIFQGIIHAKMFCKLVKVKNKIILTREMSWRI